MYVGRQQTNKVGPRSDQTKINKKNSICCFPLGTQLSVVGANTGWLGIKIMCFRVATCLPADYCCVSELALSALVWYKAAIMSSNVSCSRNGIVDNLLIWRQTTINHSFRQTIFCTLKDV